jgi:hypothetical protein
MPRPGRKRTAQPDIFSLDALRSAPSGAVRAQDKHCDAMNRIPCPANKPRLYPYDTRDTCWGRGNKCVEWSGVMVTAGVAAP